MIERSGASLLALAALASLLSAGRAACAEGTAPGQASPVSPAAASSVGAPAQAADDGVYYGPTVDDSGNGATDTAETEASGGAFLSRAHIMVFSWGHPGVELKGAQLVLNGNYVGTSPLDLRGALMDSGVARLSARLDGYSDATRPAVRVPAEGVLRVAMADEGAAAGYTTPSWAVGLGLMAASLIVYRGESNPNAGLALAASGLGVIALSQALAHWVHLPALRRKVDAYNARPESEPRP